MTEEVADPRDGDYEPFSTVKDALDNARAHGLTLVNQLTGSALQVAARWIVQDIERGLRLLDGDDPDPSNPWDGHVDVPHESNPISSSGGRLEPYRKAMWERLRDGVATHDDETGTTDVARSIQFLASWALEDIDAALAAPSTGDEARLPTRDEFREAYCEARHGGVHGVCDSYNADAIYDAMVRRMEADR